MNKIYFLIFFFISQIIFSQVPEPVSEQDKAIILYNAEVHVGDGTIFKNGYVCFDSGKITHVGDFDDLILSDFQDHLHTNNLAPTGLCNPRRVGARAQLLNFEPWGPRNKRLV